MGTHEVFWPDCGVYRKKCIVKSRKFLIVIVTSNDNFLLEVYDFKYKKVYNINFKKNSV